MSAFGVKRICLFALQMSAYDPKRTFNCCRTENTVFSALWTAQVWLALGAKNIAVEISDPLPSARRDVEVADRTLDLR